MTRCLWEEIESVPEVELSDVCVCVCVCNLNLHTAGVFQKNESDIDAQCYYVCVFVPSCCSLYTSCIIISCGNIRNDGTECFTSKLFTPAVGA